jgi:hypothetical protein
MGKGPMLQALRAFASWFIGYPGTYSPFAIE